IRETHCAKKTTFDLQFPLEIINLYGILPMMRGYLSPAEVGPNELDMGDPGPIRPRYIISGYHILTSVAIYYSQITMINSIQVAVTKEQLEQRNDIQRFMNEFPMVTNLLNVDVPASKIELPLANLK